VNTDAIDDLISKLQRGEIAAETVVERIREYSQPKTATTDEARIDVDRRKRCGYPEVVFCQGKTSSAVVEIFETLSRHGEDCFATRASTEQAEAVLARFPNARHNPVAKTLRLARPAKSPTVGQVAVVTAGTGDRPVAEEAVETLRWIGCEVDLVIDVGVAGPHRLQEQMHRLQVADAIVVIAGMEGALPSVVGGYVRCPVIAVPTSVGYGASFGGVAALLGMLNSCAANVTVVNIDAGFKGGYVAGLIARGARRSQ